MCGISFSSPLEWMFVPTESSILARPDSRIGFARIYMAEGDINGPEDLQSMLPELLSAESIPESFDIKESQREDYLFGAMSYRIKKDKRQLFTRIWYRIVENQLFFALYGCSWRKRNQEAALREQQQCEHMILTARQGDLTNG